MDAVDQYVLHIRDNAITLGHARSKNHEIPTHNFVNASSSPCATPVTVPSCRTQGTQTKDKKDITTINRPGAGLDWTYGLIAHISSHSQSLRDLLREYAEKHPCPVADTVMRVPEVEEDMQTEHRSVSIKQE